MGHGALCFILGTQIDQPFFAVLRSTVAVIQLVAAIIALGSTGYGALCGGKI